MGTRGRKSVSGLMVGPVRIDRPEPPYNLTDDEVAVWRMTVNAMSADHFSASHFPLLVQLCRHVVTSDRVKLLIEQSCTKKELDLAAFQQLLAMQNAESSEIVRLMRSLRLSLQSVYRSDSARNRPSPAIAPWHAQRPNDEDND